MAVIHIHGGGFTAGSKTGVQSSSRAFAGLGYVSIAAQYRLAGQGKWLAQIEDGDFSRGLRGLGRKIEF